MNAYTYIARVQRDAAKSSRGQDAEVRADSVRDAKAEVIAMMEDRFAGRGYGLLSVVADGEVIARHEIFRSMVTRRASNGALVDVLEGKWREIAIPAATVASRGYRVVGKYTERGSYNGHRADTCDRCGSGIKRVVVIEDRMGREYHVGTDCAGRMGLPVKGMK